MNPVPFYQRPLFIVSAAFAVSMLLNIGLLFHAGKQWGEAKAEAKLEDTREQLANANASLAASRALAGVAESDRLDVLDRLDAIAERAQRERVVYKTVAAKAPLAPNCAPGAERINAVNGMLGPGDKP